MDSNYLLQTPMESGPQVSPFVQVAPIKLAPSKFAFIIFEDVKLASIKFEFWKNGFYKCKFN